MKWELSASEECGGSNWPSLGTAFMMSLSYKGKKKIISGLLAEEQSKHSDYFSYCSNFMCVLHAKKELLKKVMLVFSKQATQWVWLPGKLPTHFKDAH